MSKEQVDDSKQAEKRNSIQPARITSLFGSFY